MFSLLLKDLNFLLLFFNWTMAYRLDSDKPYPYGSIVLSPSFSDAVLTNLTQSVDKIVGDISRLQIDKINTALQNYSLSGIPDKTYRTIFRRKSREAAWLVRHCDTASKRENYIHSMAGIMQLDVFGRCSNEPRCEKIGLRGFRSGPTQIGLYSDRRWLEA